MKFLFFFLIITFSSFSQEDENFYPFKDSSGWGVKRVAGVSLFVERYDSVLVSNYSHYKNRILVKQNHNWGVIDSLGQVTIPILYKSISNDEFGYYANKAKDSNSLFGYLGLKGDALVPFSSDFPYTYPVGSANDFIIKVTRVTIKSGTKIEKEAIYSSDGVRRTDFVYVGAYQLLHRFDFDDSLGINDNYFELQSVNNKYGIYSAIEKRVIIPCQYEDAFVVVNEAPSFNEYENKSPVIYCGDIPVFRAYKNDSVYLIDTKGNVFFQREKINANNEGIYVNENGEVSPLIGNCYRGGINKRPPYVMKDDEGFFLVDKKGASVFKERLRFLKIDKVSTSKKAHKDSVGYIIQEKKSKLVGVYDHKFELKIPIVYKEIKWIERSNEFRSVKIDGSIILYNQKFEMIPTVNGVKTPFFIKKGDIYKGINADSIELNTPDYVSFQNVRKAVLKADTSLYILSDNSSNVDVYNGNLELMFHFKADFYQPKYFHNSVNFLYLYKRNRLSVFDFKTKDWVFQNVSTYPTDSIKKFYSKEASQRSYGFSPKRQYFHNEIFFWVYNLDDGWVLFDMRGEEIFKSNVKGNTHPQLRVYNNENIVCRHDYLIEGEKYSKFINQDHKQMDYKGDLFSIHHYPKMNKYVIKSHISKVKLIQVIDENFNVVLEEAGRVTFGEDYFILFDQKLGKCDVYTTNGVIKISDSVISVGRMKDDFFYVYTSGGYYNFSKYNFSKTLIQYYYMPRKLTDSIYMLRLIDEDGLYRGYQCDFVTSKGEIRFKNYLLVTKNTRHSYFVIKNEEEELWVTYKGVVFHRNTISISN